MAKVFLQPIGAPLSARAPEAHRDTLNAQEGLLRERRATLRLGWGASYQDRTRARGKMTVWDRVEALADPGSAPLPIQTFVNWDERFGDAPGRTSPSAGVVTAFVQVHGRWVVCIANDNTVASGSWWPRTPEKIIRAQEIALRLKLPVVYLVDCSGLFLPEQGRSFPGKRGAGHIFAKNSELSAAGVPQLAGVFGDCIAGGGYMPIISDKVLMTESAYMVIAGAALIQGAKSQNLSSLDIGGADVHVHLSQCADERVPDDASAIERLRQEVALLGGPALAYYRFGAEPAPPIYDPDELLDVLPASPTEAYDVRQVIARLVDNSLFWEWCPHQGVEVCVGIARVDGLYVGIVANVQGLLPHPLEPNRKRPGGILYREGVAKVAAFSRACNDDGIPLLWLQDISGFDIGAEAERQGLLGYGSSLIYTNTTNQTPMLTVLLRKASGAGYYAMAGLPYEPFLQLATPATRLAVMEGKTLAMGAFHTKLNDRFEIASEDPEERAAITAGMRAVESRIEADMDPYKAAAQMDVDEIVAWSELRDTLCVAAQLCYQGIGHRRIKNPRIWSLHDLDLLLGAQDPMHLPKLPLLASSAEESVSLLSPKVGRITPLLQRGARCGPGQAVALLEVLGSRFALTLPEGVHGSIERWHIARQGEGRGYKGAVVELRAGASAPSAGSASAGGASGPGDGALGAGQEAVLAPTEGQFYRRAAPDQPPFVSEGQVIEPGAQIGLLEVMKFFHPLRYEGQRPMRALRYVAPDATPVEPGTPLLLLEEVPS